MKNVEKIKPTGLFTNYIFKAIPLAFDESLSYYECLCGLLSYLKETVIPTVNNNADAIIEVQNLMTQLQNYVDNYFNNLDVQEEINNKLDKMVKDGTFDQIIEQYLNSSAIWGFDTVADMKNATNLINGSFAQTLGYYNKNDGGGALYKIRNITNEDVVNNGSIISLNNNKTLIAELIKDTTINVKQFGAYGDDVHDDTIAFQNAITTLSSNNTLYVPNGKYKITSELEMNDTLSLIGTNGIPQLIFTGTGNLLKINGHTVGENDHGDINSNADRKPILEKLMLLCDTDQYFGKSNTVGIKFNSTDSTYIARSSLKDIRIYHFEKGIILPNLNFFIMTFNNVDLTQNTNGIYLDYGKGYSNAGERITFTNSIFDTNDKAITFNELKYDLNIDNCSIDYNTCFINANVTNTDSMGKISITNCHYETNFPNNTNDNVPHGFFYGNLPNSTLNLINNMIYTNVKERQFIKSIGGRPTNIYLTNNCFWFVTGDWNTFNLNYYYVMEDYNVFANGNRLGIEDMGLPFSTNQILNEVPGFTYINASGTASVPSAGGNLTDSANKDTKIRLYLQTNIDSYEILSSTDNVTKIYKPLKITNSTNDSSISLEWLEKKRIKFDNNDTFYYGISGKNLKKVRVLAEYYDSDNNFLASDTITIFENNTLADTDLVIPRAYPFAPHNKVRPNEYYIEFHSLIEGIEGKDVYINSIAIYKA